ncbi:endonuclease/exonuclease/phosphatase family protein [Streptomyces sp. DT2A-34]|uniref:endonuclease/exonuclease/phosphatase family protein n=1 Tax=Streptomyces sp. DT2A-34 TaxID=3051182 RepID=UPI00265B7DFE|nr:endonuclease/exonuclease/phosphatase family protein [Streptomyces sp. DT2A-34]MDO0917825.1 endonuclease/exonuclease/phosphatase family protein [Streptomyces sp. DT2A-34]
MPSEADILAPPQRVAERVARWETFLDGVVPAKKDGVGANLLISTWNLRAFSDLTKAWTTPDGASPKRNFTDVHLIASVIRRFDVVAVQETRGNLRALRYLLKVLGDDWAFILTDVTLGKEGNGERLAFLFDTRRVKPSGLACELVVPIEQDAGVSAGELERQFARTPYAVSFLSQGQTFTLVTLHVLFGESAAGRVPELKAIAKWLATWAEREFGWDHNLIALGDFNIDRAGDPLFEAFTSTGLVPAPQLTGLARTIFDDPGAEHFYDQIAWFTKGQKHRPVLTLEATVGGHINFVPDLKGERTLTELSWHISDHYPLWVEFAIPGP